MFAPPAVSFYIILCVSSCWVLANSLRLDADTDLLRQPAHQSRIDEQISALHQAWPFTVNVTHREGEKQLICTPECTGHPEDTVEPFYRFRTPNAFNVPSFQVPNTTHFWSGSSVKECLRGRTVLFLGDSNTAEIVMDLLLVLTGDVSNVNNFAASVTKVSKPTTLTWSSHLGSVKAAFHHAPQGDRNFTISMPDDQITLKFRYIGHAHLSGKRMGIKTLLDPAVVSEIRRYISVLSPDTIVINSGQHDSQPYHDHVLTPPSQRVENFKTYFAEVLERHIKAWLKAGIKVTWLGNMISPDVDDVLSDLDNVTKNALAGTGAKWISIRDVVLSLPDIDLRDMPEAPHIGMIAKYHKMHVSAFPSQFRMFKLMDTICKDNETSPHIGIRRNTTR
eukprot:gnl/TRDRNA2_/TRDRNA2_177490_c3_seq9.p1 gnl/TRDRNA2_/TRDRNA2_177490_c3~~gnl/TRDRNA2_/TRDRNA2_177490_c3_seq9.p1  ORF type:complete len:392 (-),score=21.84 gnl/TRDRNA2_/TRDRNA2_177490_c3_seq9:192-1367(-)